MLSRVHWVPLFKRTILKIRSLFISQNPEAETLRRGKCGTCWHEPRLEVRYLHRRVLMQRHCEEGSVVRADTNHGRKQCTLTVCRFAMGGIFTTDVYAEHKTFGYHKTVCEARNPAYCKCAVICWRSFHRHYCLINFWVNILCPNSIVIKYNPLIKFVMSICFWFVVVKLVCPR